MSTHKPTIHILGLGALGGLWAAKLLPHNSVEILPRPHSTQVSADLKLVTNEQTQTLCIPSRSLTHNSPLDIILVFTKAYDALTALNHWRPMIGKSSLIVLFQNGMGSQQAVAQAFPNTPVFAASTTEGANRPQPDTVIHAGRGQTWIGPLNQSASISNSGLDAIVSTLKSSGLTIETDNHIEHRLWHKLAINCGINPYTALLNLPNGDIVTTAFFRHTIYRICQEVSAVSQAAGYPIGSAAELEESVRQVCQQTAANISSTLQDVRAGRCTELAFMTNFIVQKAHSMNIVVPQHQTFIDKLNYRKIII